MKLTIIVIDGMGGGIGVELISRLKEVVNKDAEIIALGTNAVATERMVKAGANRGATGENAIKTTAPTGHFIFGPIGIVINNSMLGEITQTMTSAILTAPGERILLPLQNEHFYLAGLDPIPLSKVMDKAVELFKERLKLKK